MSRSSKGSKGSGHEYWGRRPCKLRYKDAGPDTKKFTHRAERNQGKIEAGEWTLGERWIVVGTMKNGEPYVDDVVTSGRTQPKARAEYLAQKENARGGNVKVVHQVWDGPGVRWKDAKDQGGRK